MYKLILVVLAIIAVAAAQYIATPYAYGYRTGYYGYPAVSAYGAYPYAAYGAGYLYK